MSHTQVAGNCWSGTKASRSWTGALRPTGLTARFRGREEAVWQTALVLLVQVVLGRPALEVRRTASALLKLRGQITRDSESPEVQDIDVTLTGWPWSEGNFSWVEPTAWACLALRHAGHGGHPRVDEGLRLLLDRAYDEGGINYGNRRVLGRVNRAHARPDRDHAPGPATPRPAATRRRRPGVPAPASP